MIKPEKIVENVFWLFWTYIGIAFVWQALEMLFYGEVQPRKVDDIIGFLYTALIVISYKCGLKDGFEYYDD